jgi:hypothetical protein
MLIYNDLASRMVSRSCATSARLVSRSTGSTCSVLPTQPPPVISYVGALLCQPRPLHTTTVDILTDISITSYLKRGKGYDYRSHYRTSRARWGQLLRSSPLCIASNMDHRHLFPVLPLPSKVSPIFSYPQVFRSLRMRVSTSGRRYASRYDKSR